MRSLVLGALLTALLAVAGVDADLTLQQFDGATYPHAVCTDGSQAGYYWKPAASAAAAHVWLVYLEGGGWCWDEASCAQRCGSPSAPRTSNFLCSSKEWPQKMAVGGLFWPANDTLLRDANKAFVHYCTSDGHMGDAGASTATSGWHFRGQAVVEAVLRELVVTHGLGMGTAGSRDTLIFGGGSAGARGGMVHLDYVPAMLQQAGVPDPSASVAVVGFLDSPLWINMAPFPGSSFVGFNATTKGVFKWANVSHLGTACEATYPGQEAWKCMFGQYRMPLLQTPYLLVASQYDAFQLGTNVGHKPSTAAQRAYATQFAARTRALMLELRENWGASAAGCKQEGSNAVFSWACYSHDVDCSPDGFDGAQAAGSTMDEALSAFLGWAPQVGGSSATLSLEWVDDCQGFACGPGCAL